VILSRVLVASLCIATISFCCFSFELVPPSLVGPTVPIIGEYFLGTTGRSGLALYRGPYKGPYDPQKGMVLGYDTVVPHSVARIGWDKEFILVERHPLGPWIYDEPDSDNPRWYIIIPRRSLVFSDLSYESFLMQRERLGIPDTIRMRETAEVYGY
jgi:hypothetical protein